MTMASMPIDMMRTAQQRAVSVLKADHMTLGDISARFGLSYDYCKLVLGRCDIKVRRGGRFTQLYRKDRVLKTFDPRGKRDG